MNFSAAILAGGKSSRMGRDKRLIEVGGQPLWQRQMEILRSLQPAELVISGPLDGPWKASLPLPAATLSHPMGEGLGVRARGSGEGRGEGEKVIPDRFANCGPLAGIAAVLESARSPLVLVLAVDMPQMSAAFLQSLLNRCTSACGIVPMRGELYEPLAAIYPQSCIALAEAQLHSKNYSLQHFVRGCIRAGLVAEFKVTSVDEKLFCNFNSPTDLPGGTFRDLRT